MKAKDTPNTLDDLHDDRFYRVADLISILKNLGLNYSIYTIRDYETWKCLNYKCGKRYTEAHETCPNVIEDDDGKEVVCGSEIRPPLIDSPRTRSGGKGVGHRRYTGADIKKIVEVFKQRQ